MFAGWAKCESSLQTATNRYLLIAAGQAAGKADHLVSRKPSSATDAFSRHSYARPHTFRKRIQRAQIEDRCTGIFSANLPSAARRAGSRFTVQVDVAVCLCVDDCTQNALICRDERDCGRGFLSGVVWPAPGAAGAGSAPDVSPCFLCVVWLVRVRRAAWFLRVLQEMLVFRDIPEVPGRLMGDGRAVCP